MEMVRVIVREQPLYPGSALPGLFLSSSNQGRFHVRGAPVVPFQLKSRPVAASPGPCQR